MSNPDPASELISLPEAARRYGLSPQTLRLLAQKGRLKAVKMGRDWFTTPRDVQAYLSSRMKTGRFRDDIAS
jgi:excisionase family DNA binding protein